MIIAMPSKNRVDGMTALKIFKYPVIFVEPQDLEKYKEKHSDKKIVCIDKNDMGFGFVLRKIVDYTIEQGEKYFLFVDDDIFGLKRKDKKDFDIDDFTKEGEEIMDRYELAQLGVSFGGHNWYHKSKFKRNTAVWGMGFMNAEKIKAVGNYNEKLMLFNDYEITARLIINKQRVLSWYDYMFLHKMGAAEGGANTFYKKQDFTKGQIKLLYMPYQKYMKIMYHKKHKLWEFRFNWKKLEKDVIVNSKDIKFLKQFI